MRLNYGAVKGSQTLSGGSTFTGGTDMYSGRLVLDYSTDNTSKLNDTNVLTLRGGTLELSGGSHNEVVGSTTFFGPQSPGGAGQINITRSSGTSTIALGALSWPSVGTAGSSGAINFSHSSIATTTSTNTRGILGDRARFTVGGADWASVDGSSNIVTLASYDTFVGSGGDSTKNYLLSGSGTVTANQTLNTLKITTTAAGQSLALGNTTNSFSNNGLLFTGMNDYSITTGASGTISGEVILHNYGSGVLTLGRMSGSTFEHAGTGKTVLTTDSTSSTGNSVTGLWLDSGTLQFSKNSQLVGKGNLRLNSGVLVADTSGGSIALTNDSAGGYRTIGLGTDVPVIDVIGGNTLTLGGVISGNFTLVTPIIFGSATSDGTIEVFGNNTYQGDTRLDGGRISVNSSTSFGTNASIYNLVFSRDSILNIATANASTNITTSRYYNINSGVTGTIETDATTTLTQNGTIAGAGNLRKSGTGTLTLGGTNTYTGATTISNGTLALAATGSIDKSSGINLGSTNSPGILDVSAKSSFLVGASQTLSGAGSVVMGSGNTLTIAGNLAPGNSAGIITVTNGNAALTGTTVTTMEVAGSGGVAGTDFDQLNITSGSFAYGGALTITNWGGYDIASVSASYNFFDFTSYSGNFASVNVNGFGLTYDLPNTKWSGTNSGITYDFTLADGALAVVVPEPSTYALLAGAGLVGLIARFRLRRRSLRK